MLGAGSDKIGPPEHCPHFSRAVTNYIVTWNLIVGILVGLLTRALVPGRDDVGILVTIGLGISGAIFGSILGRTLGMYGPRDPTSLIMSAIGAATALLIHRRYFVSAKPVTR